MTIPTVLEHAEQLMLLDPKPLTNPITDPGASLRDRFTAFHEANPHVYEQLRVLSLDLVGRGAKQLGIGMLFEVLRWVYAVRTSGDEYRLNNNHRAFYARLLMESEPELRGKFHVRTQPTQGAHHER